MENLEAWKELMGNLYPRLPHDVLMSIVRLLKDLTDIMQAKLEQDHERYEAGLQNLNPDFRNRWPLLACYGTQFLLTLFDSDTSLKSRYVICGLRHEQFELLLEADILLWKMVNVKNILQFEFY